MNEARVAHLDAKVNPPEGLREAALDYARRGWHVFPCHTPREGKCSCGKGDCPNPGKHPRTEHGFHDATTDEATLRRWWGKWPDANIGIRTGAESGLVVLDQDGPQGRESLSGKHLPVTPTAITGRGEDHVHRFYAHPGGHVKSRPILAKVDLKGDGGYIVAPPSLHVSGRRYEWVPDLDLSIPLAPCPLLNASHPPKPEVAEEGQVIAEGARNTSLTRLAGAMRHQGCTQAEIEKALSEANRTRCRPPLPEEEVQRISNSVGRYASGKAGEPRPTPWTLTATELSAMEIPQTRWVVRGLLPEGVSLLAGRPKIGKSWLALGMAVAVATGERALGSFPTERGEVLYLAMEDNPRRLKARLETLDAGPQSLHFATSWARLDEGGLEDLAQWLTEHPAARLVVVDTLQRVRAAQRRGGNLYAEDVEALAGLQNLAGQHRIAVLVLHHRRKLAAEDPLDLVSGTTGLTGCADTVAVLDRGRGQADGTLSVVGRDVEDCSFALRFDSGAWTLLGDAQEYAQSKERKAILDLLRTEGPMTPKAVAETLGANRSTTRTLLQKLVTLGMVRAGPDGLYSLPVDTIDSGSPVDTIDSVDRGRGDGSLSTGGLRGVDRAPRCPEQGSGDAVYGVYDVDDPATWPTCRDCERKAPKISPGGRCADCLAMLGTPAQRLAEFLAMLGPVGAWEACSTVDVEAEKAKPVTVAEALAIADRIRLAGRRGQCPTGWTRTRIGCGR